MRIRLINAGSDTAFRFAMGGHTLTITHTDGFPVERWRSTASCSDGRTLRRAGNTRRRVFPSWQKLKENETARSH
ncbi:hypothetical protein [Microbacterium laevaniformans]|uniref:hypothetical protein n=1 Tax=Microbacterium laevaniformans TaxID=36807 RepID=UPI0031E7F8A2